MTKTRDFVCDGDAFKSTAKAPEDPCKCGRYGLKSWWKSITDAGNEGTDFIRHSRSACLTKTERDAAKRSAQPPTGDPRPHGARMSLTPKERADAQDAALKTIVKEVGKLVRAMRAEVDRLRAVVSVARWIQADLKANEGRVSIEREADLDDALIDLDVGESEVRLQEKEEKDSCPTPL
jgi:hypothetical protein